MRVYIGKHVEWFGPWQIAKLVPFVSNKTHNKIGKWLSSTWVNSACEWFYEKRKRKVNVRIDPYDTWNTDHTLALIILPMLKQIKESKDGSPYVDDEDLPPHMRYTSSKGPDDYETVDNWVHYKWEWILKEMIWTFENILDTDWESKYTIEEGEIDWDEYPEDECKDVTPLRWKKKYVIDWEGRKAHQDRITNGLKLFGKYYRNLWT